MEPEIRHIPVLAEEAVGLLQPRPGRVYLDATVGLGGHAHLLLTQAPGATLVGVDQDLQALRLAAQRLGAPGPAQGWFEDSSSLHFLARGQSPVWLFHMNYAQVDQALQEAGIAQLDGALFDLGVSSLQLDDETRGFTYRQDVPLDMRMDQTQPLTAREIVNTWPEAELARILRDYGEEHWARRIARFICTARRKAPLETSGQLVEVVKAAIPAAARRHGGHPARRTFQALRMAVNHELENLDSALHVVAERLTLGGRLVVISFHSLEDRLVKDFLRQQSGICTCPPGWPECRCGRVQRMILLTRHPLEPGEAEVEFNRRARSAHLRAAMRVS